MPIAGAFNFANALCAIGCAHSMNVMLVDCINALSSFKGIPGRMEQIDAGQNFSVYIDFTVTPQSYESTLSTLKSSLKPGGRLLVLAGSCGDRMKEKRPIVGKIVSSFADIAVIANEDPYTEDPEKIIDEVWAGIDQKKTDAHRIFDRREAIRFLLKKAKKDDIVIFCGKGSDTTMMMKSGQIPWNEREIVAEELRAL
jgi:UDP-N-acetylmuramyl tripeptide synthase